MKNTGVSSYLIHINQFFNHHQPVALTNQSTGVSIQTPKNETLSQPSSKHAHPNATRYPFPICKYPISGHGVLPDADLGKFHHQNQRRLMFGSIVWMKSMGAILPERDLCFFSQVFSKLKVGSPNISGTSNGGIRNTYIYIYGYPM